MHGGKNCTEQGLGAAEEVSPCNEDPCPGKKTLRIYLFLDSFKGFDVTRQIYVCRI